MRQKVIIWWYIMGPYCNLHLKDSKPISSHDVQFMMLYQHTKFGCKRFSHSDDILQTRTDILNLCCELKFTHSHPVFSQDSSSQWCIITLWLQKGMFFRRNSRNSPNMNIRALAVPLKIANHSFDIILQLFVTWWCITIPSLATNGWAVQMILSRQTDRWFQYTIL